MKNFKKLCRRGSVFLAAFCCILYVAMPSSFAASLEQGLKAAAQEQWQQAQEIRSSLPVHDKSILTWYLAYQQSPLLSSAEITAFVTQHPQWPRKTRLLGFAEKQVPENMALPSVVNWFDENPPRTAKGVALYMRALLATGQSGKAKDFINKWWAESSLDRDEQKELFTEFGNILARASHIARLHMLLDEGDLNNARAIGEVLGGQYKALAEARIALQNRAGDVVKKIDAVNSTLQNDPGFLLDRLIWRRQENLNDGAIQILNHAPAFEKMRRPERWWKERHILIRRLMEEKNYQQAYKLANEHRQQEGFPKAQAEWVAGFLALEYLKKNWDGFEHFEKLYHAVESPISRARGAYWAGLASERMGYPDIAGQWFAKAAGHGETFYGQLAAEKMGGVPKISFSSTSGGVHSPINQELERVARAFVKAGLNDQADIFLRHLADIAQTASDFKFAAQTASQLGFPHIAIAINQQAVRAGYWLGSFAYPERTSDVRQIKDVEWALLHGLMRQESRFDQYARSPAGAMGLMQLMPGTARETARKNGVGYQKAWLVSRPEYNIKLGSSYIRAMVERYDGNYAMALAAYNAGPARVEQWIRLNGDPRKGDVDLIKWIESIPIYETRNYVQRVLEAVYVYRQKFKSIQPPPRYDIHIAIR